MTDQKNKQGSSGNQGPSGNDMKQPGNTPDPKSTPQQHSQKPNTMDSDDTDEEVVRRGADIENPDMPGADKRVELDDNPDETQRKIPNM